MNTIAMLLRNLFAPSFTVRLPNRPIVRSGYRGLVHYEPSKCTGCSMCAFRCTSRAITFRSTKTDMHWSYDPAQCTYCGRCVDGCDSGCLTQDAECPPVYLSAGALKSAYITPRTPPPAPKPAAPASVPASGEAQ
jgi:formate hydrogenlyase subunit 6/NADH:ubiquinone oxidoreductase subunit I